MTRQQELKTGLWILIRILCAIVGLGYCFVLEFLGACLGGAGHGTEFFLYAAMGPANNGIILWIMIGFLVCKINNRFQCSLLVVVLLIQYGCLAYGVYADHLLEGIGGVFEYWLIILLFMGASLLYLGAHFFAWWRIVHFMRHQNNPAAAIPKG